MSNEIPISIIKKDDAYLLYFDKSLIKNYSKIEAAFIKNIANKHRSHSSNITVSLNKHLTENDLQNILQYKQPKTEDSYRYNILVDVTDVVKMIASDCVKNKGIVLSNVHHINDPRLQLYYYKEKIYPCCNCGFYEKKISLCGYALTMETPWFFSGMSNTITFFIHNNGNKNILINIENSPDALIAVSDVQKISVSPKETVDIVPYKFSKYVKLIVRAQDKNINCKIWFQTQLRDCKKMTGRVSENIFC